MTEKPEKIKPLPKYNVVDDPRLLQKLCFESDWVMQEKIDGVRSQCGSDEEWTWARNNTHYITVSDTQHGFLAMLPGTWAFDGEMVGNDYYIFDMIDAPESILEDRTFMERHMMLQALIEEIQPNRVHVVPIYTETSTKLMALIELRNAGAEGVVFHYNHGLDRELKGLAVPYKFKFYQTVDCIVMQKSTDGKRVCEIGLFRGQDGLVSIGRVKVEYDQIDRMKGIDPVVEVRYRRVSEGNKLIEPVFQRIRTDKPAYQCTWEQLPKLGMEQVPKQDPPYWFYGSDMDMSEDKFKELFWPSGQ